jgi:putative membrane protein
MLHGGSVAVNLLPRTWSVAKQAWPLLLVLVAGGSADRAGLFEMLLLGSFLASTVGGTVMHFLTLRYRMVGERLEIRTGLLQRQTRVLTVDKVQNVEMVRNLFHRLSGLVEVRIETASGGDVEGLLSALSEAEAAVLVAGLSQRREAEPTREGDDPVIISNDLNDLLWFGASTARVGAAVVVVGVLMEALGSLDPERMARVTLGMGSFGYLALGLATLLGAWLVGIVNAVVRHHAFRLSMAGDRLVAEEGLLTKRRVELPVRKVQVVTLAEPWLRRQLGFGSMIVETAAARMGTGGTERALSMVPVVRKDQAPRVLRQALPVLDVDLEEDEGFIRPHRRALLRAWLRSGVQSAVICSAASWWWWPWGALVWLASPVPLVIAWLDWSRQGWQVTDDVVVSRRGYLDRVTRIVARDKLQSVSVEQGPLLRSYGLAEVLLRVAGSGVVMPLLDYDEALRLASRLSASIGSVGAAVEETSLDEALDDTEEAVLPMLSDDNPARG